MREIVNKFVLENFWGVPVKKKVFVEQPRLHRVCKKTEHHVDFFYYKRLNDAIPRQTNITHAPFFCASACPPGRTKTLLDAKYGFHSVVLAEGESQAARAKHNISL